MTFGIRLEDNRVASGETIRGTIYFDIEKQVSAKQLVAVLQGQEYSRVKYTRQVKNGDRYRTVTRYATAQRPLLQQRIPIDGGGTMIDPVTSKIQPGKYVIPFEARLPPGLPSTMETSLGGSSCSISYSIRAQIEGSGWIQDYKTTSSLFVESAKLSAEAVPFDGPPDQTSIYACGCLPRGHMIFGAKVTDTLLDRGEAVRVDMACRNRSLVPIKSVEARLIQDVRWSAQGHSKINMSAFAVAKFGKFPGLERIASLSLNKQRSVSNDIREVASVLQDAKYSKTIAVPVGSLDTFAGTLIKVRHYIVVAVCTTGCCITEPQITIPIQVGPPRKERIEALMNGQEQAPDVASTPTTEPEIAFDFANATTANTVYVPPTAAQLGGAPQHIDVFTDEEEIEVEPEISLLPMPSVGDSMNSPYVKPATIEQLLIDCKESIQDYDLIQQRIDDPMWATVFVTMTPSNFGKLIQQVDLDFDQPKIAAAIARKQHDASPTAFTCDHVIAAVQNGSEWNKGTIVEKLLPYTHDLARHKDKILAVLSEWDRTVTERAFEKALKGK